jgi:hypothetical protein
MAYATVAQLRAYLTQVATGATNDALLTTVLARAHEIVNDALGFAFDTAWAGPSDQDVYEEHSRRWLTLPYHQLASVAAVSTVHGRGTSTETTTVVDDWLEEADGRLYLDAGWTPGWYRVEAAWGYGPAPAHVVEVELRVAVNIWRGRDASQWQSELGAEGQGAVPYNRALTWAERSILDGVRMRYLGVVHA